MNTEIYQYMRELHTFIEHQSNKIKKLETVVYELQQEIAAIKEKPPLQIGNIEYKFDQLKVETLEGTLNIGLNPSDLEGVSDFSVDNKNIQTPFSPKDLFRGSMEVENKLREYIDTTLPEVYKSTKEKLSLNIDDSYYQFIKEDILKQLPNRVQTHLNSLPAEKRESEEAIQLGVFEKIKNEIQQGVYLFLEQVQKQTKGEQ